jgi:hypothetical protein
VQAAAAGQLSGTTPAAATAPAWPAGQQQQQNVFNESVKIMQHSSDGKNPYSTAPAWPAAQQQQQQHGVVNGSMIHTEQQLQVC